MKSEVKNLLRIISALSNYKTPVHPTPNFRYMSDTKMTPASRSIVNMAKKILKLNMINYNIHII